jgi:hypothetical protein
LRAARDDQRKDLVAALLAGLGREPTGVDRVSAEALASAMVNLRRKQALGVDDTEELKMVTQLLRATGLTPPPPAAPTEHTSDPFGLLIDDADTTEASDAS